MSCGVKNQTVEPCTVKLQPDSIDELDRDGDAQPDQGCQDGPAVGGVPALEARLAGSPENEGQDSDAPFWKIMTLPGTGP